IGGDDGAGVAGAALLGEVGDDVRLAERPDRLEGHQFGIARADADADQPRRRTHDRSSRARALIAAAVTALPPRRPRTVRNGAGLSAASASFDSAAPTKPTGMPTIAAGAGAPARSISSRWKRAVGALPMATTAPARRSRQSSSA